MEQHIDGFFFGWVGGCVAGDLIDIKTYRFLARADLALVSKMTHFLL